MRRLTCAMTVQIGKGCQNAMSLWWVSGDTTSGVDRPMRTVGMM